MSANTTAKLESGGRSPQDERQNTDVSAETDVVSRPRSQEASQPVTSQTRLSSELAQLWLAWQCRMVAGVIRGAVCLPGEGQKPGAVLSAWPDSEQIDAQLIEAATVALNQGNGVVRPQQHYGPEKQRICDMVASPLLINGEPVAAVAVMMSTRSEPQQNAVLQLLQWGGLWIETLVRQQTDPQLENGSLTLGLVSSIFTHSDPQAAAMDVSNQLADKLGCEYVSLGFRRGLSIQLQALSHVAGFDSRTQLARHIEAAMEEAADQGRSLTIPGAKTQEPGVRQAHAKLLQQQRNATVCTVPLPGKNGYIGAITLERNANRPFDGSTVQALESLAKLLGPAFEMKMHEARTPWSKGVDVLKDSFKSVFGPSRFKLKLSLLAMVVVVAALSLVQGSYKVTAPASIEGSVRQLLVASQDGYIKQADVRAGDQVKQGELIALLDDRSLQLERQKWLSDRNKIEKEYQDALASRDRAQLSILRAQIDQVDAEIKLVDEHIAQTQMLAPFDGVVVSGDLSQSLGAPVEIGQALFEIAPLDSYRIVLEIDEHDVAGLEAGKTGQLVMAALPRTTFGFSLEKLLPVAVSGQGNNYFRVEAVLDDPSPLLRPGMRGVAKVEIGERSLLWNLTHSAVDRIRLWAWSTGL